MKNILIGILLSLSCVVNAQEYLVTQKGDTISGNVKILTYDNLVDRVEVSTGPKKKEHFKCIQVKAVVLDGKIYKAVRTNNGYRFMQLSQEGFLSLYLARRLNSSTYEIPVLVKRNGESAEVPGMGFKKVMANFLSDCPNVSEKISKDAYTRKDVSTIITDYNDCLDAQTAVTKMTRSSSNNIRLTAFTELKNKIDGSAIPSKMKASDILADITDKLKAGKAIPGYLLDGLRDSLSGAPEFKDDLDKAIAALNEQ